MGCSVTYGTKLKILIWADCLDRFDDGQDAEGDERILQLLERIIHFPDIVDIELVYDVDYWAKRSVKKTHNQVHLNEFIRLYPTYDERKATISTMLFKKGVLMKKEI